MEKSKVLKWFWGINYCITLYKLLFIATAILCIGNVNCDWFSDLHFSEFTYFFDFFGEWVQFPLCLLIIILYKSQRTPFHYFFLSLLIVLALITILLSWLFMGYLGDN